MDNIELEDEEGNIEHLKQYGNSRIFIYDRPKFNPERLWNKIKAKYKKFKQLIKDTEWYKNRNRRKNIPLILW